MNNTISVSHQRFLKAIKNTKKLVIIIRIAIAVIILGGWELLTRINLMDSFIFSSPTRIVKAFIHLTTDGTIFKHTGITICETLICFVIVMGLGLIIAMLLWRFNILYKILEPYLVLLNSLPKSALAPLLIVWFGNNMKTIIVAAVSVAVFGTILSIYTAFMETEPDKIKLMTTLGSSKSQTLSKLIIPQSLPSIINIMKVNLGLSLVGVIIGEFLAARQGLGYMIIYATQTFKMDWVILSIVILALLSVGLYQIINIINRKFK